MTWTLLKASEEFGVARETIRRGLITNKVREKKTYTTREIHNSIAGDLQTARAREATASAMKLERENAEQSGEVVSMSEVSKLYTECLLPIRQRFLALPGECATRCNPSDSQFARDALQRWVDESLPLIREQLPKGK